MKQHKNPLAGYDVRWEGQSIDAGASMPLGGHDMGCNVWAAITA